MVTSGNFEDLGEGHFRFDLDGQNAGVAGFQISSLAAEDLAGNISESSEPFEIEFQNDASADLRVTASVSPESPIAGAGATIVVEAFNDGGDDATEVVLSGTLPVGARGLTDSSSADVTFGASGSLHNQH